MSPTPCTNHIHELENLQSSDGLPISVFEFRHADMSTTEWSAWAQYFRRHYCDDALIDAMKAGTPYESSRADYLRHLVFPDSSLGFGPATRSGDFAEILVADLIEERLGFWVPRTRYASKQVRNESPKGSDILGMRLINGDGTHSASDEIISVEAKAQLSGRRCKPRLQHAVDDSVKDSYRRAESLNAAKQRLMEQGRTLEALRVQRFQSPLSNPYVTRVAAAAVYCGSVYDAGVVTTTDCSGHPDKPALELMVITSDVFMSVVHSLYEKAANEA